MNFNKKDVDYQPLMNVINKKYQVTNDFQEKNRGNIVKFKEIEKARDMMLKCNKPMILVDSDADGVSSAAELVYFYNSLSLPYEILTHEIKSHGISNEEMDYYLKSDCDLLIISDAGSNNIEQISKIIQHKKMVILDHHIIEKANYELIKKFNEHENFVLVSPLINNELNPNLTGAFVVLETLKPMCDDNIFPIAIIGEIGDCGDTSDIYIHKMVNYGLSMLDKNILLNFYNKNNLGQRDLSFSIIPLINSCCRVGTPEDNKRLVEILSGVISPEKYYLEKRKKNKVTRKMENKLVETDNYQEEKEFLEKLKQKQNRITDNIIKKINEFIIYNQEIVVTLLDSDIVDNNCSLSGLIANKLMSKYQKPAIVLFKEENNNTYFGSIRSNAKTSFKEYLTKLNAVNWCKGHDSSAGVEINDLEQFIDETMKCPFIETKTVIDVDILRDTLDKNDIIDVENNKQLFGGAIRYPIIGYNNISFLKNNCFQKGNTIRLKNDDVEVVLYKQPENRLNNLIGFGFDPYVNFDFYGVAQVNNNVFFGEKYQIIAEEIELKENNIWE